MVMVMVVVVVVMLPAPVLLLVLIVLVVVVVLLLLLLQLLLHCPPPKVWCQYGNKGLRTWAASSALPSRLVWRPIRIIMRRLHPHLSCRLPVRADLTSS